MAENFTQDIPAELLELYEGTLGKARDWKQKTTVRKRYPWKLPQMRGNGRVVPTLPWGSGVTWKQFLHRRNFKRSCDCFGLQPYSGGAVPPTEGPRNRSWWFDQAIPSGLWYYDYFIQQTINEYIGGTIPHYCKVPCEESTRVRQEDPNNWFGYIDYVTAYNDRHPMVDWVFIRKNNPKLSVLHFWVLDIDISRTHLPSLYVDFYACNQDWNPATLTWNTKPPTGKYLSTTIINRYGVWIDKWVEFALPYNVFAVIMTIRTRTPWPDNYGLRARSVPFDDESLRPFWT